MENRMRSVLKSVSFRLIATLTTTVLVLVFTSDILLSLEIGAIEFFGKIALYYFHERLWNMFQLGRK
jgi:adenylylsulfate kinase